MASTRVRRFGLECAALIISLVLTLATLGAIGLASLIGVGPIASGDIRLATQGVSVVTVTSASGNIPTTGPNSVAGRPAALTVADVDAIARAIPEVRLLSRVVSGNDAAVVTDAVPHASVQGVDPSYAQIWGATLARGAFFTDQNATAANRVAVISQSLATSLFPTGQAPIGSTIRIRNQPFTVVGVLAAQLSPGGANANNTVFIPFQTGQVRLFGTRSAYELVLQVRDAAQAGAVREQVQQLLRQRHRLGAGQASDFTIRTDSVGGRDASQTATQTVVRAIQLVDQYACQAKAVCSQTQLP